VGRPVLDPKADLPSARQRPGSARHGRSAHCGNASHLRRSPGSWQRPSRPSRSGKRWGARRCSARSQGASGV